MSTLITFTFTFNEGSNTLILIGLTNLDLGFRVERWGGVGFLECEIYDSNKYINKYLKKF